LPGPVQDTCTNLFSVCLSQGFGLFFCHLFANRLFFFFFYFFALVTAFFFPCSPDVLFRLGWLFCFPLSRRDLPQYFFFVTSRCGSFGSFWSPFTTFLSYVLADLFFARFPGRPPIQIDLSAPLVTGHQTCITFPWPLSCVVSGQPFFRIFPFGGCWFFFFFFFFFFFPFDHSCRR